MAVDTYACPDYLKTTIKNNTVPLYASLVYVASIAEGIRSRVQSLISVTLTFQRPGFQPRWWQRLFQATLCVNGGVFLGLLVRSLSVVCWWSRVLMLFAYVLKNTNQLMTIISSCILTPTPTRHKLIHGTCFHLYHRFSFTHTYFVAAANFPSCLNAICRVCGACAVPWFPLTYINWEKLT